MFKLPSKNLFKLTGGKFNQNLNLLSKLHTYKFTEVIPSKEKTVPTNIEELLLQKTNFSNEEIMLSQKLGVDLYLNQQKLSAIENSGFYFIDPLRKLNFEENGVAGWRLKYLNNMRLLEEYDNIFREFLQNCARFDTAGLDLQCEPRFSNWIKFKLSELKRFSFNLEVNTIKIRQNYKILRMEIYKNLNINRNSNDSDISNFTFSKFSTPLAPLIVAKESNKDNSLAENPKPFILATTMLVQSPMRMAVWNQNLSKEFKVNENKTQDYVVRFETQMNYSDFFWILPTQNKPSRTAFTKITDFNNTLRGNPYFVDKLDLDDINLRHKYMTQDAKLDEEVNNLLKSYNATV